MFQFIHIFRLFININIFYPIFIFINFCFNYFKISMRTNIKELDKSLENIGSIDILDSSNGR